MSRRVAMLGVPHAGKTVWLGRLWHAVDQGRRRLTKRGAPDDLTPLRVLGDALEGSRFPDRTNPTAPPTFSVPLSWGDVTLDLEIADYNGEELDNIWTQRDAAWSPAWDQRAHADGLAVFVRADRLIGDSSVLRPVSSRLQPSQQPTAHDARSLLPAGTAPDHDQRDAPRTVLPAAVAIVELLQLLRHIRGLAAGQHDPHWRVAVLLSAWDAVPPELQAAGPGAFLRDALGLLDDLLATSFPPDRVRVFGLSAVGGDLEDSDYVKVFEQGEVDDHGWLSWDADGVRKEADITLPIGWLLLGDEALPTGEPWGR